MIEDNLRIERSGQVLVIDSGEPPFGSATSLGVIAITVTGFTASATIVRGWRSAGETVAIFIAFLFFFGIFFVVGSHQWITEIDTATRRLKTSRRSFGRWTKDIIDCSFDECSMLGIIKYNNAEDAGYRLYVQLKDGKRHNIPLKNSSLQKVTRIAFQLSAATGISRPDTRY
jgi:hypothetical protein